MRATFADAESPEGLLEYGLSESAEAAAAAETGSMKVRPAGSRSYGRPPLAVEVAQLAQLAGPGNGSSAVVFACGPSALIEECAELTLNKRVDFKHEVFLF